MKIKKLEWYDTFPNTSWASTDIISFVIFKSLEEPVPGLILDCTTGDLFGDSYHIELGRFSTFEEAKQAAQTFYEKKIKEHLEDEG